MKKIRIDVPMGSEDFVGKIRSWIARVPEKYLDKLDAIYLLDDASMNMVARNMFQDHLNPSSVSGFVKDRVIVLRIRSVDELEQSFYHEIAHVIYSAKTPEERKKLSADLSLIWGQYFRHFLKYKDPEYEKSEDEIFARIYSFLKLLTGEKAVIDLRKTIGLTMMGKLEGMFA